MLRSKTYRRKNEVILINPYYETIDSVRPFLSIGPRATDVDKYEREEKTLVIMDSLETYTGQKKGIRGNKGRRKKERNYLKSRRNQS